MSSNADLKANAAASRIPKPLTCFHPEASLEVPGPAPHTSLFSAEVCGFAPAEAFPESIETGHFKVCGRTAYMDPWDFGLSSVHICMIIVSNNLKVILVAAKCQMKRLFLYLLYVTDPCFNNFESGITDVHGS